MDKNKVYQELFDKHKAAYPDFKPAELQQRLNTFWNSAKTDENFEKIVNTKLQELSNLARKKKCNSLLFWAKAAEKSASSPSSSSGSASTSGTVSGDPSSGPATSLLEKSSLSSELNVSTSGPTKRDTPAQTALQQSITILESEIACLVIKKKANLLNDEGSQELTKKRKLLDEAKQRLLNLKKGQKRANKSRSEFKRKLQVYIDENPELKKAIGIRGKRGRPATEEDQPDLLKAIIDIATYGSAADSRRRTESIRCIKTLDDLTGVLRTELGYNISRSGVYLRLIPRRIDSIEGKRHTVTVPVKLIRAQNESHKEHSDTKFATATIRNLEEIASVLGPKEVFVISQDDKARVPIGITAANKQSPLLMHMEYRVTLPDHDWVIAPSHKLIPSVYAGIKINEDQAENRGAVTYSGPTYIAIRSGKHCSSTAFSHATDIGRVFDLPEFQNIIKDGNGAIKPVGIFTVDGGPDENPRYMKVITVAIHHFITNDLDALFVACNAPGRSAFNRVERRMAPLSKELGGVILPHDHFGTHLNGRGETIDQEKEKLNFSHAGHTLSEIWSAVIIDQFPVISEYINPEKSELDSGTLKEKDMAWHSKHVRSSQYFLQVIKCTDTTCCSKFRSSILKVLPRRFFPAPLLISQGNEGLTISTETGKFPSVFLSETLRIAIHQESIFSKYTEIPYDISCPSVKTDISRKVCAKCGIYHASLTYLKSHSKHCKMPFSVPKVRPVRIAARRQKELLAVIMMTENQEEAEWIDEEFVDEDELIPRVIESNIQSVAPLVSMKEHLQSPWE